MSKDPLTGQLPDARFANGLSTFAILIVIGSCYLLLLCFYVDTTRIGFKNKKREGFANSILSYYPMCIVYDGKYVIWVVRAIQVAEKCHSG